MHHVGVLAYGSLLTSPGSELAEATDSRVENVLTPFPVEFARRSKGRGDAPTLVPVASGGSPVIATVLVMRDGISLPLTRDMTYRRERNKVGQMDVTYMHRPEPGPNQVHLSVYYGLGGVNRVIATELGDTIPEANRTGSFLAKMAIESVVSAAPGRDGISYLRDAISMAIITPLTEKYTEEVLRLTGYTTLDSAITALGAKRE